MNANRREWLTKTVLLAQHTAPGRVAVGLRQKALLQRFLIATTASRVFPQPVNISVNPCYPRENDPELSAYQPLISGQKLIRVYSCSFAVKKTASN
jgi:hypothetical protein